MRSYLDLVKTYPRLLSFGLLHAFFVNLGMMFTLGIFVPHIRASFGMQRTEFGAVYLVATLVAAFFFPHFGRLIDRFNLRLYSHAVGLSVLAACWITASATTVPVLALGLLGLRFSGHGLMGHVESTSVSRYFGHLRGKALGITSLGYPLGTAVLPVFAAWLIARFDWRTSFFLLSSLFILVFLPLGAWLLRGQADFQRPGGGVVGGPAESATASLNRRDVLRSPYFYFILPLSLLVPFCVSSFLFHQGSLSAYKGWGPSWVAYFLVGWGISQILSTFGIGPMVDRFTARRILPFHLLPMGAGFAILATGHSAVAGAVCFCLIGVSDGFGRNVKSALWAEVYGPRHVGAIRSMYFSIAVLAAAVGPTVYGGLLDAKMNIDTILLSVVVMIAAFSLLSALAPDPRKQRTEDRASAPV
ncbi:MFS transporter [Nitrospinota bacterium]